MKVSNRFAYHSHVRRRGGARSASISARLLQAQDNERRRISRELHDTVGQSLAAVQMSLQSAVRHMPENTAHEKVLESIRLVEETIRDVRTVAYLLHPPTLDVAGLASALDWYCEGFSKRSGIQTTLDLPPKMPRFPMGAETALFRFVQECLTNVHRHSGAFRVWIRCRLEKDKLRLEVEDNGHGMKAKSLAGGSNRRPEIGVGILGMTGRLSELGGHLDVHSGPWGTKVSAVLPRPKDHIEQIPSSAPQNKMVVQTGVSNRLLIVDDHELMRRGVRNLVEEQSDLQVCDEAANAKEAIEKVQSLHPDLIILDMSLGGPSGWTVVSAVHNMRQSPKILIFTSYDYVGLSETAQKAGCQGFLTKSRVSEDLVGAVRTILQGGTFFPRAEISQAISRSQPPFSPPLNLSTNKGTSKRAARDRDCA